MKKFWLIVFSVLFILILVGLFFSPFLTSDSIFADYERREALRAGAIGLFFTFLIGVSGYFLIRKKQS